MLLNWSAQVYPKGQLSLSQLNGGGGWRGRWGVSVARPDFSREIEIRMLM